jgi:hypothetical protein
MQLLHLALAARDLAAASPAAGLRLAAGVPDPSPQAPPGMAGPVGTLLGWFKWGDPVGAGRTDPDCPVLGHRAGAL